MTEDMDKWRKYVHGGPTLGSRMAKEQNRPLLKISFCEYPQSIQILKIL